MSEDECKFELMTCPLNEYLEYLCTVSAGIQVEIDWRRLTRLFLLISLAQQEDVETSRGIHSLSHPH